MLEVVLILCWINHTLFVRSIFWYKLYALTFHCAKEAKPLTGLVDGIIRTSSSSQWYQQYPACRRGQTPAWTGRWCGRAARHGSAPCEADTTIRKHSPNSSGDSLGRLSPGTDRGQNCHSCSCICRLFGHVSSVFRPVEFWDWRFTFDADRAMILTRTMLMLAPKEWSW